MKKLLFLGFIVTLFYSCKTFIQIYDTSTMDLKTEDGYFVYENDTLEITYSFWASHGIMSFAVYNKLDVPIYIDWKKSSFIYNDNKLNYWVDESHTTSLGYYGSYFYKGPLIKPGFAISEGVQVSNSTTFKPERITFIPPKSDFYRSQFYLWPDPVYQFKPGTKPEVVPRNDKPKRKTSVLSKEFTAKNSPLIFRNYLSISLSENDQNYFYIDNEFYLSSVKKMDYRHYRGKKLGYNGSKYMQYEKPFKRNTSFYIKLVKKIQ